MTIIGISKLTMWLVWLTAGLAVGLLTYKALYLYYPHIVIKWLVWLKTLLNKC